MVRVREVGERFPDGVLWATLGQQPDVLSLLAQWIQALGDYDFRPTSASAAAGHLRTLLHRKAALLVIDDAWEAEHVMPFLAGGPRCRALLTTRRADVAEEVSADLFYLDVMSGAQALRMLAFCLGRSLEREEKKEALAVAAAVGYSPLALELATARVRRGIAWHQLRKALEQEIARLEELEGVRRRRAAHTRLEASLNLSLEALRRDDEEAWRCFVALGVLPEDAVVTAPLASSLWEKSLAESKDILELLWSDALLLLTAPNFPINGCPYLGYRLHNLLHDVARRSLVAPKPVGAGLTLPMAHSALLDRYQARCSGGLWQNVPDDGYIHARLSWHMEKAGRIAALHTLMCEQTASGENAWSVVRQRLGQTAGYLADVARAWHLAEDDLDGGSAVALGQQCVYAGITASFVSIASSTPPELMAALLRAGIWTPAQALAYASQSPAGVHPSPLSMLIPLLPDSFLPEALALSRRLVDDSARFEVLRALQPRLTEELSDAALDLARHMGDGPEKTEVLVPLLASLPDRLLASGIEAISESQDTALRVLGLLHLLPRLSSPLSPEITYLMENEKHDAVRALALQKLRGCLSDEDSARLLEVALKTLERPWRAVALQALLPWPIMSWTNDSGYTEQPNIASIPPNLQDTVQLALNELDPDSKAAGTLSLALPGLFERLAAKPLADQGKVGLWRVDLPLKLLPPESGGLIDPVYARHFLSTFQEEILSTCLPMLCENDADLENEIFASLVCTSELRHLDEAAAVPPTARSTTEVRLESFMLSPQWDDLVDLVPVLPIAYLTVAEEIALSVSYRHRKHGPGALHINLLTPSEVPSDNWDDQEIEEEELLGPGVSSLPPSLCAGLLSLWEEKARSKILDLVGSHVPKERLDQARQVSANRGRTERLTALSALASNWHEVLEVLATIENTELLTSALFAIAPCLPDHSRIEGLRLAAAHLPDELLERVARELLSGLRVEDVPEVLELAAARDSQGCVRLLVLAVPHLPRKLLGEVLRRAHDLHGRACLQLLEELAPLLPQEFVPQAVALAEGLGPWQLAALTVLLVHLPDDYKGTALEKFLGGLRNAHDTEKPWRLLPFIPGRHLPRVLKEIRQRELVWPSEALLEILPRLPESAAPSALEPVLHLPNRQIRIRALSILLPSLGMSVVRPAILEVLEGLQGPSRVAALLELSSKLKGAALAELLDQALAEIPSLPLDADRELVLAEVVALLAQGCIPPTRTSRVWRSALQVLETALPLRSRVQQIGKMVPFLPANLLENALVMVSDLVNETERAKGLSAVAARLPDAPKELVNRLLEKTWTLGLARLEANVLEALGRSSAEVLRRALEILRQKPEKLILLRALLRDSDWLNSDAVQENLREILSFATSIGDAASAAAVLGRLGLELGGSEGDRVLDSALDELGRVADERLRVGLLAQIALWFDEKLADAILDSALGMARASSWSRERVLALARLAPFRPLEILAEAKHAKGAARCKLTCAVAPFSDWRALLSTIRDTEDEPVLLDTLSGVLPSLPAEWLGEALGIANDIKDKGLRARAFALLGPRLTVGDLPALLRLSRPLPTDARLLVLHAFSSCANLPIETLVDEACGLGQPDLWLKVLGPIPEELPPSLWSRALAAFHRLPDVRERKMLLYSLSGAVFRTPGSNEDLEALREEASRLDDAGSLDDCCCGFLDIRVPKSPNSPEDYQSLLDGIKWRRALESRDLDQVAGFGGPRNAYIFLETSPRSEFVLDDIAKPPSVEGTAMDAKSHLLILQIVDAARTARLYQEDEEGAWRLLEFARSVAPRHPKVAELTAWLTRPPMESQLPLPGKPAEDLDSNVEHQSLMSGGKDIEVLIQKHFATAQAAFECGWYDEAIDEWSRVFLLDLDNAESAECIREARLRKDAAADVSPGVPGANSIQAHLLRSRILTCFSNTLTLLEERKFQEALLGCDFILRLDPAFEPARRLQDELRRRDDEGLSGRGWATTLGVLSVRPARRWVILGDRTLQTHRYRAALDAWDQALKEDPSDSEAAARFQRVPEILAAGQQHLVDLLRRALSLLDVGDTNTAILLWLKAMALDVNPGPEAPLLEEASRRLDSVCESRMQALLAETSYYLARGEFEAALISVSEVLRIDPERSEARSLAEEARRRLDEVRGARVDELLLEIRRAVLQGKTERALAPIAEVLFLDPLNPTARHVGRQLHELRSGQRRQRLLVRRSDRLRKACASGDLGAIAEACEKLLEVDFNHQEAGWFLRLTRGFQEDECPVLLPWSVVDSPLDSKEQTLIVLLARLAGNQMDFSEASLVSTVWTKLDQGDLDAAISLSRDSQCFPNEFLYTALRQRKLAQTHRPLGEEEIENLLSLVETAPLGWPRDEATGSWASNPVEFLSHLARLLPKIPDDWLNAIGPPGPGVARKPSPL